MTAIKENSTNSINRKFMTDCDLTYALQLIGGRWKLLILMRLENGPRRFSELKRVLPNITERMLTLQLRELEGDGLVSRKVYAEVPPRVEYAMAEIALDLLPVCAKLFNWGAMHRLAHAGAVSELKHS